MPSKYKRYLDYVSNTGGGATEAHFKEDWEPIGEIIWDDIFEKKGFVSISSDGKIFLTEAGEAERRLS